MMNNIIKSAELEESKKTALHYMQTLVDVARESFIILNSDLRVIFANDAFYQNFKVSRKETENVLLYDLGNKQWDIPELRRLLKEILPEKKTVRDYEVKHTFETIGERTIVLNARQIDSVQLIILAMEDITAHKMLAEKELRESEERYRILAETAPDMFFVIGRNDINDVDGTIIYVNQAVKKITGYLPEEVIGKKAEVLWKTATPIGFYENFWHTIKDQKKTFIGEIQNKRKNGEIYTAAISVSPMLDAEENIMFFVGTERDVTKEREIDKAKSEFISLASHQMRTPLTAINWYLEMLVEGSAGELTAEQKKYFDEIYIAAQSMNEIIKSFLHILRLETDTIENNPVPVKLGDVFRAIISNSKLDIEKRSIRVVEHYQASLPLVKTDAELTKVVFQNLITNAIKYTPEKGEMTVTLRSLASGESAAGKTVSQDSVLASVHNTGMVITGDDKEKIFSKFFRAESAKRLDPNGNGIGLYMAKKMVDAMGGFVWFDSEEERGTTFYVLLSLDGKKLV